MKLKMTLLAGVMAFVPLNAMAADLTIGFSQIGSESGWRAAETTVTKQEAEKRGIDLKFADAQQKQENQIKAIRSFIAQGVDAILLAPVVATGWDEVLEEAKDAEIPVLLLDRTVDAPDDLYLTAVTSDLVHEGEVAGDWLQKATDGKECNIVELQGTTGSSPAIDRKKGFEKGISDAPNLKIIRSQTGDFTRSQGKVVMESFLKAEGGANICALYAHNDDMAVGALFAAHKMGLVIPDDLSITGFDDTPVSALIWPPLTTIHQPIQEMGYKAVELITDQIKNRRPGPAGHNEVLEHSIVERQSTAPPHDLSAASI